MNWWEEHPSLIMMAAMILHASLPMAQYVLIDAEKIEKAGCWHALRSKEFSIFTSKDERLMFDRWERWRILDESYGAKVNTSIKRKAIRIEQSLKPFYY